MLPLRVALPVRSDVSEARHTMQSRVASGISSVQKAAFGAALGLTLLTGTTQ